MNKEAKQMTREVIRYKLNELRMMLNDGEHTEEQGILVDIIKELDKAENKGEWIPVSERLPLLRHKVSDDVLITNGHEIDMGYRVERKGKAFWHYYGSDNEVFINGEGDDAIAWQPLPEPYKAESEDKE